MLAARKNEKIFTDEEEQIKEVIIASRKLEEYLWGEYNCQWNIEEWRRMFRKRVLHYAALSIASMNILDTKGIPTTHCDIPSNLPQYAESKGSEEDE